MGNIRKSPDYADMKVMMSIDVERALLTVLSIENAYYLNR